MVGLSSNQMIGHVAVELTRLPEEDLPLVLEFVQHLKQRRQATIPPNLTAAEMVTEARRRARALESVPRETLVARFVQLVEEIRQTAMAKGTAIEGDWQGD